jgi:sugar (pentulose or hexulose) kinase
MGLWIVQQARLQWNTEGLFFNYTKLTEMAAAAGPAIFYIDPNDERFFKPGWSGNGMVDRIVSWCLETEQPVPKTPGEVIRGVLESLARTYTDTIRQLEEITGDYYPYIHVIGGGSQNYLLCQLTANASERQVYAGPVEATALGNLMLQAIAAGDLVSIEAGRNIIYESSNIEKFSPQKNT